MNRDDPGNTGATAAELQHDATTGAEEVIRPNGLRRRGRTFSEWFLSSTRMMDDEGRCLRVK